MTYNVFGGTLSLTQSINQSINQDNIFGGYDFTGGRISNLPTDFCTGLTTVQHYCAACDYYYYCYC